MFCTYCGQANPNDFRFCVACGNARASTADTPVSGTVAERNQDRRDRREVPNARARADDLVKRSTEVLTGHDVGRALTLLKELADAGCTLGTTHQPCEYCDVTSSLFPYWVTILLRDDFNDAVDEMSKMSDGPYVAARLFTDIDGLLSYVNKRFDAETAERFKAYSYRSLLRWLRIECVEMVARRLPLGEHYEEILATLPIAEGEEVKDRVRLNGSALFRFISTDRRDAGETYLREYLARYGHVPLGELP